jgi:flagellar motor switch protein FliM
VTERALTQHEIDEIVQAVRDGRLAQGKGSLAPLLRAQRLDFRHPSWGQDRIVRRRLPVLDLIFDRLGPFIQVTLSKNLRFPVRIENLGVELHKFNEFRDNHGANACLFENVRLDPLNGGSLIVFEPTLLYALVDALMGGLGVGELPGDRDISEIEVSLLYKLRTELLRDFENAWKPWFPLRLEHVRSDRNMNVVSGFIDEEVCHIATLMISGDVLPRSPIHFVHPYSSLEPLFEATSSRGGEDLDPSWKLNLETHLRRAVCDIGVEIGATTIPTARVRSLAPGDVLELDTHVGEEVDVHVDGEPVFKGHIGQSHSQYAVKITQRRKIEHQVVDRSVGQTLIRKGLISLEQLQVARVDEMLNRKPLVDSIVARGWVERKVLEAALG